MLKEVPQYVMDSLLHVTDRFSDSKDRLRLEVRWTEKGSDSVIANYQWGSVVSGRTSFSDLPSRSGGCCTPRIVSKVGARSRSPAS